MDPDWGAVVAFGISSGVVAGSVNQGLTWLREKSERKDKSAETRLLQADERDHEARLRAEAAHADAAQRFGDLAADVADWIDYQWGVDHGHEVDYIGVNRKQPGFSGPADAIDGARQINRRHPTKPVRMLAGRLADGIDSEFNQINGNVLGEPKMETYAHWSALATELIDAILSPPTRGTALADPP